MNPNRVEREFASPLGEYREDGTGRLWWADGCRGGKGTDERKM